MLILTQNLQTILDTNNFLSNVPNFLNIALLDLLSELLLQLQLSLGILNITDLLDKLLQLCAIFLGQYFVYILLLTHYISICICWRVVACAILTDLLLFVITRICDSLFGGYLFLVVIGLLVLLLICLHCWFVILYYNIYGWVYVC